MTLAVIFVMKTTVSLLFFLFLVCYQSTAHSQTLLDLVKSDNLVTLSETLSVLNDSEIVAFGETHAGGTEKETLEHVMSVFFNSLNTKFLCGVETIANAAVNASPQDNQNTLIDAHPPIQKLFSENCSKLIAVDKNGPGNTNFTQFLSKLKNKSSKMITYTGLRHILPWGKYFSDDFSAASIDLQKKGTIQSQIPAKFLKTSKFSSISFVSLDELYLRQLKNLIKVTKGKKDKTNEISKLAIKVADYSKKTELSFLDNELYKIIKLANLNNKNENHFLVIYNTGFNLDKKLTTLLQSNELHSFLGQFNSSLILSDDYLAMQNRKPKDHILAVSFNIGTTNFTDNSGNLHEVEAGSLILKPVVPQYKALIVSENTQVYLIGLTSE